MITHRTTYLCDQCGLTSEDYNDGVPLRWIQVTRNVPAKPHAHFCGWKCLSTYFAAQLATVQPAPTNGNC